MRRGSEATGQKQEALEAHSIVHLWARERFKGVVVSTSFPKGCVVLDFSYVSEKMKTK